MTELTRKQVEEILSFVSFGDSFGVMGVGEPFRFSPHDLARALIAAWDREEKLREALGAFVAYDESCDSPDQTGVEMMIAYDDAITAARAALTP